MDMFTHLQCWLKYLEGRLGHSLESNNFISPHISHNGTIDPKHSMSYDTFQKLLGEFMAGAGLMKTYTTHCFQRGGAQYHFMYAPIGSHWSLVFAGPVRWTGKKTEIGLNPTAKDQTTGCGCTNSEFFRLPVAMFVEKSKNRKKPV